MRDLTAEEEIILRAGRCPFCGSRKGFQEGPHGGMSVNVKCANCGTKLNLMGPFTPELIELGPEINPCIEMATDELGPGEHRVVKLTLADKLRGMEIPWRGIAFNGSAILFGILLALVLSWIF